MKDYSLNSEFVKELDKDILNLIKTGFEKADKSKFNDLALREFELQFNSNEPYRKYCIQEGIKPEDISCWEEIPAVPSNAFKEMDMACIRSEQAERIFMSSGTTNPKKKSKGIP